jgi:hypothetical protein
MINWKVTNLKYYEEVLGLEKVVCEIYYIVEAKDDLGNVGQCFGSHRLDLSSLNAKRFISFDDITREQAISWVKACLSPREVEELEGYAVENIIQGETKTQNAGLPSNW